MAIQQKLMKNGYLVPPGRDSSPLEVKAYGYIMEAKAAGQEDAQALRDAAKRIAQEHEAERVIRREEHKRLSQERRDLEHQRAAEGRHVLSPDEAARLQSQPRPELPALQPAFAEDPENPLPKPPSKQ